MADMAHGCNGTACVGDLEGNQVLLILVGTLIISVIIFLNVVATFVGVQTLGEGAEQMLSSRGEINHKDRQRWYRRIGRTHTQTQIHVLPPFLVFSPLQRG